MDFWHVYGGCYDEVQRGLQQSVSRHPACRPELSSLSDAQNAAAREQLIHALERDDWAGCERQLRGRGEAYAELGIDFTEWCDVVALFERHLVPKLIAEYGADLPRLNDALGASRDFVGRVMAEVGQSYIDKKARDPGEKKTAADPIIAGETLLSATLANLQEGVTIVDAQGQVLFRNRAAYEITGATLETLHETPYKLFLADGETPCPRDQNPMERALRGEAVRELELMLKDPVRFTAVAVSVNASPMRDAAGVLVGAVASFRDVTHQRRLEEQRARAIALEVHNRRLQEATRMKSEFLAGMSHELRTPLNAIIGLSKLLHDGRVASVVKQHEFLGDILSSGKHLLQLINDILDLSKVESGKMEFRPELVDLVRVITEVTSILRTTAAAKQIDIDVTIAADLGEVFLDPPRFKQVLYNYLSNALKFTPEAGKVSLRVEREGLEHLRLVVADTGIGISKADQAKLFVEFQQLEAGASKQYGGTGLGLALTKRLVEAQGGSVGVTSELSIGSQFYAILPCRVETTTWRAPSGTTTQPACIDGPMILVVEDDPRDQQRIASALGDAGYCVDVASSGAGALAMAREKDYAAITLDLILPDMSGLDVLAAIQTETKNKHVPVVIITVITERATGGFAVTDVLAKPLDSNALVHTLRRAGVLVPLGTVLVVDDDPIALKLMAAALERLRYRPVCYTDGEAALRDLAALAPVAIILDLVMPGLDGFEFLARLRASAAHRHLPVLVWTTRDLGPDELVRLRATAQAVLQKGDADLVEELTSYLHREVGVAESTPSP
jgi:PAS domain S-box-containing protein